MGKADRKKTPRPARVEGSIVATLYFAGSGPTRGVVTRFPAVPRVGDALNIESNSARSISRDGIAHCYWVVSQVAYEINLDGDVADANGEDLPTASLMVTVRERQS